MKKLKWIVIVLVVIVIVAVGIVLLSLDGILRSVVQTQASSSLNLPTTLGGVHLSLLGGSLALSDLSVASPKGFSAPEMFALGSAGVNVSYGQLRNNPVHVQDITLDKPKLVIEQSGGKFNLQALMSQGSAPPPSDSKGGQTMKLVIDKLTISGCDVTIRPGVDIPGVDKEINLSIPQIDMANIGNADGNQNGAAIKDVLMQVMTAIEAKAADNDKVPPALKALLSGNLAELGGQVTGQVKEELNKSIDAIKGGNPDAAKNVGKDVQKSLGGLLGGDKKSK